MTSCLYSIIDIKSKSNKEYKLFCRAENSFCITGGFCITRSVIVYLWKKGERRKVCKFTAIGLYGWIVDQQLSADVEKAMVCSTSSSSGVLQDFRRISTFKNIGSVRGPLMYRHFSQEARKHFRSRLACADFLPASEYQEEVHEWVKAIQDAREALMATSTVNSLSTPPIPIPGANAHGGAYRAAPVTPSPASHLSYMQNVTSSDSEDGSPSAARTYSTSSQTRGGVGSSPSRALHFKESSSKIMISGYLMKCGQKRNSWRKRWFVLDGEKLIYSGSHMVSESCRSPLRNDG
jgi:hypothetical protein